MYLRATLCTFSWSFDQKRLSSYIPGYISTLLIHELFLDLHQGDDYQEMNFQRKNEPRSLFNDVIQDTNENLKRWPDFFGLD